MVPGLRKKIGCKRFDSYRSGFDDGGSNNNNRKLTAAAAATVVAVREHYLRCAVVEVMLC